MRRPCSWRDASGLAKSADIAQGGRAFLAILLLLDFLPELRTRLISGVPAREEIGLVGIENTTRRPPCGKRAPDVERHRFPMQANRLGNGRERPALLGQLADVLIPLGARLQGGGVTSAAIGTDRSRGVPSCSVDRPLALGTSTATSGVRGSAFTLFKTLWCCSNTSCTASATLRSR